MTLTNRLTSALGIVTLLLVIVTLTTGGSDFSAQIFFGPGLEEGVNIANGISDLPSNSNPRTVVIDVLEAVLNFASLLAVIMIVIAGFYLILSLGEDEKKDKAKKIIYYTLIGLVVLLLARIIVGLVTVFLADSLN